jgi:hypothetical protein
MQGAPPSGTGARGRFGAGMGGPGGNSQELTQALAYVKAHGGGTLGVSSQQGAGSAVIAGKDVAGIGGFSGRESQVSVTWLADAIASGKLRWVMTDSGGTGGMPNDARVGSRDAMSAVAKSCTAVSSVSGLYDCQGHAATLAAQS